MTEINSLSLTVFAIIEKKDEKNAAHESTEPVFS